MLHRRPTARHRRLLAALLLTATVGTALSSCGFDYPTNRVNQIAAGANNRDGDVELLGIRVLSTAEGQGQLIGSLDNQLYDTVKLTAVASTGADFTADSLPLAVDGDTSLSLTATGGLPVTGDFKAGDVLPLKFTFDNGETAEINVPVVKNCYQYTSVPTPSASESTGKASEGSAGTEESASPSAESSDATYACSDQESAPATGEGE
ncbi:MAG TPA: hypothetical protein VNS55_11820 [Nocardioides sp.]|nr:hypothetical protein [Nocardioides sp.]